MELTPSQVLAIANSFSSFTGNPGYSRTAFFIEGDYYVGNVPLLPKITPFIEHVFSFGQCHSLAYALNESHGWEIQGAYNMYGGPRHTCHYFVWTPGGMADVYGVSCIDYGYRISKPQAALKNRHYLKPNLELARHYAPMVVERIQSGRRYR